MGNKLIVITGASRGIGKATLEKFVDNGDFVIATSTLGKVVFKLPNMCWVMLELSNTESIGKAIGEIKKICKERKAKIDILINNAGIVHDFDELTLSIKGLRQTLEVNLIGTADFTEHLLELVVDGGHVLNISSLSGSITESIGPLMPSYKISKIALNMYTRTLAERLKDRNITVSSVDPGWVKTDMGGEEAPKASEEAAEEIFELANRKVETGQFWRKGEKRSW